MIQTKIQSITFILLLLCATCVAPVMAGGAHRVVEDGVHLIESDSSPTQLDPVFYHILPFEDVIIDGNQYYWVRIGNVATPTLSKNDYARIMCTGGIILGAAGVAYLAAPILTAAGSGVTITIGTTSHTVAMSSITAAGGVITGAILDHINSACSTVETWFVDNKYRIVAPDGTILIGIKKTNTATIQELKKDGIDINKLSHLSKDGVVLNTTKNSHIKIKMNCDQDGLCIMY